MSAWCLKGLTAPLSLQGIAQSEEANAGTTGGPEQLQPHPNTCQSMMEVVLYTQNLDETVRLMAASGLVTHKGKDPRAAGDRSKIAVFMVSGIRLLVVGPRSGHSTELDPKLGWMAGTGRPLELVGWLPVVGDIEVLSQNMRGDGTDIKKAAQPGRRICSLHASTSRLTGTFAFLGPDESS